MEDNVAGEGLLTLQDAEWFSDSLFFKTAGYNWTVDSCSTGVAGRSRHACRRATEQRAANVPEPADGPGSGARPNAGSDQKDSSLLASV